MSSYPNVKYEFPEGGTGLEGFNGGGGPVRPARRVDRGQVDCHSKLGGFLG